MDRYYAAACQTAFKAPTSRQDIADRTSAMLRMAENTIVGYQPFHDIRLLVFPEFSHAVPIHDNVNALRKHLTVELPNEHTDRYHRFCQEHGVYIQTGTFLEHCAQWPELVFNTTLLIGPDGILSRYRKTNPWIPWEVQSSPADVLDYQDELFPVVDTEIGKLGVAICYDWLFPETIRQIAFNGAEVICRVSAYMDPWGATPPMDWWTLFNRARAVENQVYVVAANQGAQMRDYPPFSWPGGSMLVDFDGRVMAQADPGPGEKVVVGPIDLAALRAERARRQGHDMRAHLRPMHAYVSRAPMAPDSATPSIDGLKQRIAKAKSALS